MAGLRKRTWQTKNGITTRWELSYMIDGKQYKKTFKKKPTPQEMAEVTQVIVYNPTVKDFIKDYLENNTKLHCKSSTYETYENYYKVALVPLYRHKIKDLKRRDIENYILNLKEEKAAKTVNNILVFIKAFLNYAIENKIIIDNPAAKIKQLPLKKEQVKVLTKEQLECFRKKLKIKPFWVMVFFSILADSGMRISECIALEWSDIDFDKKTIKISKQYYRYRLTSTKNYETREIDIPDNLVSLLQQYRNQKKNDDPLLFSFSPGKYINVNNLREKYFSELLEEVEEELNIDLIGITPHCLRHTHATYLLSNGIPLIYVSKRLGHRDCKTTLNIYNHVVETDNEKALKLLNKIS